MPTFPARARRRVAAPLLAAVLLAVGAGCATNPVTGRSQLALIGEAEEIALGRQADQEVLATIGLYPDEGLQRYVQGLGEAIARASERPHLPWTFRVVDDPSVNAFAIPGGFVYVTRGILAHMGSEAELVSVLGHEIGHVTARHSVSQMSKAQLASLGLGVAMILAPEARQFGDLAQVGLGLLFLKFSRSDEAQADALGLRYLLAQGYDPRPMGDMFRTLERVGEQAGGGRLPTWLATHPDPANRRQWVEQKVAALPPAAAEPKVERAGYLRRLDGLVFGPDPREGFFTDALFHHPGLRFRWQLPTGWATENAKTAVSALSPEKDARLVLELSPGESPEAAARAFFQEARIADVAPWRREIGGLPAASYAFSVSSQDGRTIRGLAAWVAHEGKIFRLLGFTPAERWTARREALAASIAGFARERDTRVLAVEPQRLSVLALERGGTLADLVARYPSPARPETLALINQLAPGGSLPPGSLFKRVVGNPLP